MLVVPPQLQVAEGKALWPMVSASMTTIPTGECTWNIILPICSRGATESRAWSRLEDFAASVRATTTPVERTSLLFSVGIDEKDPVFDNDAAKARLRSLLPGACFEMFPRKLADNGLVCEMWNR